MLILPSAGPVRSLNRVMRLLSIGDGHPESDEDAVCTGMLAGLADSEAGRIINHDEVKQWLLSLHDALKLSKRALPTKCDGTQKIVGRWLKCDSEREVSTSGTRALHLAHPGMLAA